jgi:hypothetical protein
MAVSRIIRPPRGPLAYPGTSPGFDPAHIAGNACTLSAVFFGGTFVDILTGRQGTISTGSPTAQMHSVLGPCLSMSSSNVAISGKRSYGANAAPLGDTMAALLMMNSSAAQQAFLALGTNGTDSGYSWFGTRGAVSDPSIMHAGLASPTGITQVVTAVPYFIAVSQSLSATTGATQTWVMVATNLLTGQIYSSSGSQGSYNVGGRNGTYNIGSRGASSLPASASIRAVMASDAFTPLPALVQWAKDPWKFWHPE